jgi:hypothetical protein
MALAFPRYTIRVHRPCENRLMAGGMDLVTLRQLVGGVLDDFAGLWTHQDIGAECERLGLPEPPPEGEHSKRVRVSRSLAVLPDSGLPPVAERIVAGTMPSSSGPAARYAIEDLLWAGRGAPEIPKRTGARSHGTSTATSTS